MRQLRLGLPVRIDIVAIGFALLQHTQRLKQIHILRQRALGGGNLRDRLAGQWRQREIRGRHVGGVTFGNRLQVAPVTGLTLQARKICEQIYIDKIWSDLLTGQRPWHMRTSHSMYSAGEPVKRNVFIYA